MIKSKNRWDNVQKEKLSNVINKIEGLEFVKEKITVLAIHDN